MKYRKLLENNIFYNEERGIIKNSFLDKQICNKAIDLFLTLRYVPAPYTMYENIKRVPVYYTLENGRLVRTFKKDISHNYSFTTFVKKSRQILLDNIEKEIEGEEQVALLLSGGVDSSIVLAALSKFDIKIKTYTLGFAKDDPDLSFAKKLANYYSTEHKEIILDDFPKELFEEAIRNMDLPNGDPTIIPVRLLVRQIDDVNKIFVGEGGDEVFGGYPEFRYSVLGEYFKFIPDFIKNMTYSFTGNEIKDRGKEFFKYFNNPDKSFLYLKSVFTPEEKLKLYSKNFKVKIEDGSIFDFKKDLSYTQNIMKFYLENQLPGRLISKYPKDNNFRFCFPLLDERLIDLMLFAPLKHKIDLVSGKNKKILREVMKPEQPSFIYKRKKRGFTVPIERWMERSLKKEVYKILSKSKIEEGRFNWDYVREILINYDKNFYWRNKLWSLFVLEKWLEEKPVE